MLGEAVSIPRVICGRLEPAGTNARRASRFIVAKRTARRVLAICTVHAVVTNIDADTCRLTTPRWKVGRLRLLLQHLPFYGVAILCIDDPGVREIAKHVTKTVVTYGLSPEAQVRAIDIEARAGTMKFRACCAANGSPAIEFDVTLNLPGMHNVRNALAAIAVGLELGVAPQKIAAALASFKGVGRRFQQYGEVRLPGGGRITVIE